MLNTNDILETIQMITDEHLDVRTVTMGISLLDCADPDGRKACEKIYRKITEKAKDLVKTAEDISATYGMPIVNKRISVTPIAMLLASAPDADPVWYAKTLDAAAKAVGVNFIGGPWCTRAFPPGTSGSSAASRRRWPVRTTSAAASTSAPPRAASTWTPSR